MLFLSGASGKGIRDVRRAGDLRVTVNAPVLERPANLKVDLDTLTVTVESLLTSEQIPFQVDIQKVIEYFAR